MKYRLLSLFAGTWLAATVSAAAYGADSATSAAGPASTAPATVHFDINRFDVRGNTLLPQQTLDSLLTPFVGKSRDFSDVMGALEAVEAAYHAQGYQLVRIDLPEQELDQGVVILNVVQIKIGRVKIEGNTHFDDANIRRSLPDLVEWQAPDMQAISKSLKLANENPAKKTVLAVQSGEQDDAVDATLTVTDESLWSATLNVDNSGTKETGKTHAGVILQNANLFGLDQVLNLQYTTTVEQPSRVSVYGVGYHVPLYALGDSMDFFGSYSNVDSGTVTAGIFDLAVSGKGAVFGARYNRNLPTAGSYDSKLIYGVDYKAYKNSLQLLGFELGNDITVHPLSLAYQGSWALPTTNVGFALTLIHNVAGGSRGGQQDFDMARVGAAANYNALRFDASAIQALPLDWQFRAAVNGQYTNDALVPGEQFGAGGATSVRGFEEREISNDSGVVGNLEIYTPPLCASIDADLQCKLLAFYDHAYATRNHALPGEFQSMSISSIGVGVRVLFRKNIDVQMDVGHVLQAQTTATQRGANRLHARISLTF
jgi:hemolysin activation/secretion protein